MKTQLNFLRLFRSAALVSTALLLSSCATTKNNIDPYEKYNRVAFKFNRGLDYVVFRPVADLYDTLTPIPVQAGIGRMYTNFYEPSRIINDLLQGEGRYATHDSVRFFVNSTVGLAGFFDIAQTMGYPVQHQDFGVTMARWGWNQSAFFVVPFLGIYTVRDFVALPFNSYAFTFWPYIQPENLAWKLYFLELTHNRSVLRPADKVIDEALDPYLLVRDAYLQIRKRDINVQKSGRHFEVQPAPEQEGQSAENQTSTQVKGRALTNNIKEQKSTKSSKQKNLPDVLSVKIPHPKIPKLV